MDEREVRVAAILELVMPRPMGEDIAKLKSALVQRLGDADLPFQHLRDILDRMVEEGLLKKEERVVEGRRVAMFYQATSRSVSFLMKDILASNSGLSKGRESHGTRTEIGACR